MTTMTDPILEGFDRETMHEAAARTSSPTGGSHGGHATRQASKRP